MRSLVQILFFAAICGAYFPVSFSAPSHADISEEDIDQNIWLLLGCGVVRVAASYCHRRDLLDELDINEVMLLERVPEGDDEELDQISAWDAIQKYGCPALKVAAIICGPFGR